MGCGGCASANERCGNGLEKIYPTTAVRYGRMRNIGEFSHAPDMRFTCGAKVVISTERGIEVGEQVSLTCHGCEKSVSRDQMRAYAEASGPESIRFKSGRILREATENDLHEWKHIQDACFDKLQTCRRFSRDMGLEMKVVDCEHLFGGERIVFYFMAEQRIDFRELVHQLAAEFQTRIEMRQVGARDEARLVADFETCGRECCCKNFLKTLKPISMSMAKIQKTTLDLSKVSGRCGRLKCCLRFEHETYEEMDKKVPRMNQWIRSAHGIGQVIDRQVLTQLVKLRQADGKILSVVVEDILETGLKPPTLPEVAPRESRGEQRRRNGAPRREESAPRPMRDEPPPESDGFDAPPADAVNPQPEDTEASADASESTPEGGPGSPAQNRDPRRSRGRRRGRRRRGGGGPGDGGGPVPPEAS